jgi:hypothetical protein
MTTGQRGQAGYAHSCNSKLAQSPNAPGSSSNMIRQRRTLRGPSIFDRNRLNVFAKANRQASELLQHSGHVNRLHYMCPSHPSMPSRVALVRSSCTLRERADLSALPLFDTGQSSPFNKWLYRPLLMGAR